MTLVTMSSPDREIEGSSEFTYFRVNSDDNWGPQRWFACLRLLREAGAETGTCNSCPVLLQRGCWDVLLSCKISGEARFLVELLLPQAPWTAGGVALHITKLPPLRHTSRCCECFYRTVTWLPRWRLSLFFPLLAWKREFNPWTPREKRTNSAKLFSVPDTGATLYTVSPQINKCNDWKTNVLCL